MVGTGSGMEGGAVLGDAVRQSRPAPAAKRLIFCRKNNDGICGQDYAVILAGE